MTTHDLIIVGGGPAGASAAVFAARAGLRTLVIDADQGFTRRAMIYNHLGLPDGVTGPELVELGRRHAVKSGAEWIDGSVTELVPGDDSVGVVTESGDRYDARDVLLAVGVRTSVAETAGLTPRQGSEPRIASVLDVDRDGRTAVPHIWAAGTAADVSVHTIVTAGDGARVAINIISEQKGERYVDHDVLPAPNK